MMSTATISIMTVAAAWAIWGAIPAAADPNADPGDVQTLTPPRPRVSQADLDERFLSDLTDSGMQITNVRQVIGDAHQICAYMGAKHTEADAIRLAMHDNTTLTEANAQTLIESAEGVYCPQLSKPGALA